MNEALIETTAQNNKMINQLHRMGGQLDPLAFVQIQMQSMVEILFPELENMEQLEMLYQTKLHDVLTRALGQARQVQIMASKNKLVKPSHPRLIKPGEN